MKALYRIHGPIETQWINISRCPAACAGPRRRANCSLRIVKFGYVAVHDKAAREIVS